MRRPLFDRRNACAACFAPTTPSTSPPKGVRSFSIITFAAPGVEVPFVAAVIDCGGTSVRANIINVTDPEHVSLGMNARLATTVVGTDSAGVEAVNYGFEPA